MSDNQILPAIILAAGIASGAGLLGAQFKNLRQPGTITVKGLAEAQHCAKRHFCGGRLVKHCNQEKHAFQAFARHG